jgi:hypothetical protein
MTPLARALKQYAAIYSQKSHAAIARNKSGEAAARCTVVLQLPYEASSKSCSGLLTARLQASAQKDDMRGGKAEQK